MMKSFYCAVRTGYLNEQSAIRLMKHVYSTVQNLSLNKAVCDSSVMKLVYFAVRTVCLSKKTDVSI
jgi:hypothetical protein